MPYVNGLFYEEAGAGVVGLAARHFPLHTSELTPHTGAKSEVQA